MKKKTLALGILLSPIFLSGATCQGKPDIKPHIQGIMAMCGGGLTGDVQGILAGQLNKADLSAGVSIHIKNQLQATIMQKSTLPKDKRLEAYKAYLKCAQEVLKNKKEEEERKEAKKLKDAAITCIAKYDCDVRKMYGYCLCLQVIDKKSKKHNWTNAQKSSVHKQACLPDLRSIRKCWDSGDLTRQRATCSVKIKLAGMEEPKKIRCKIPPS